MAERKTLLLRISPSLWADLNRWAAEDLRSLNGQIEWLLRRAAEEKFGPGRRDDGATPPASGSRPRSSRRCRSCSAARGRKPRAPRAPRPRRIPPAVAG